MTTTPHHERVLIVDFGSQVTQLIARRVRESGVYCEIHPYDRVDDAFIGGYDPKAVILSGGPASVHEAESPAAAPAIFDLGVPVLGICYGEMTMCAQLGGSVRAATSASSDGPTSWSSANPRCWTASATWATASRCG